MADALAQLTDEIVTCRKCPRLVAWREQIAFEKRAAYREWDYWARPVPGFGDPHGRLLILGLAPAAHGGNRTGRVFTGDRSGDWLFGALYRAGFANQPTSEHRDDGLHLIDAYISACVRCAPPGNKPLPVERDTCLPYLGRERTLLANTCVVVCLGAYALEGLAILDRLTPRPRFGHGVEHRLPSGLRVLCSFHPSQQNTFTGKLTVPMFDAIFSRARELLG
jgi:uracil-DNA glycosylase family 4